MRKLASIIVLFAVLVQGLSAQTKPALSKYDLIPKGEKLAGVQFAYLNLNSANSEYMLLVNGLDAKASFGTVAPMLAFAYAPNRVLGIRGGYSFANGQIDGTTLSLLNDGLDFELSDVSASMKSSSVSVFHRSYLGLDENGILGLYAEVAATYGMSKTSFGASIEDYSTNRKVKLSFSPGVVFFPNQFFSTHVGLSLASVGYDTASFVKDGAVSGSKTSFKAQASLDLLGIDLGIVVHF